MNEKQHLIDIIQGCKKENEKYQELLYKKYYGYVMSIALLYLDKRELAEEVINDCFLKVFKNINSFNEEKLFKSWLRRIAVNTCIDLLRRENRFVHLGEEKVLEYSFNETIIDNLNYEAILEGLNNLPMLQRTICFNFSKT